MANRKRNREILFRLTEEEWKQFDELTKVMRKPKSTILRQLIKGFVYQPCPSQELLEYLKQLRHIGNNINQIAYIANKTGNIDTALLKDLYRQQQELVHEVTDKMTSPIAFDIAKTIKDDSQNNE